MVEKYIKDGKVAVLISPGYESGWSTMNSDLREFFLFDKTMVQLVLDNKRAEAARYAESFHPNCTTLGADDLKVVWLTQGTVFRVEEYDGFESLITSYDDYTQA